MTYIQSSKKVEGCVFCHAAAETDGPENLVVRRGKLAFVIINLYPYTSGHLMIVPYAHLPGLEHLDTPTRSEIMDLSAQAVQVLQEVYHPQGFNLGMNLGEVAGAGIVDHVHLHVVPRWGGDTNFMSVTGQTRVLPEALEDTWRRIREEWQRRNF